MFFKSLKQVRENKEGEELKKVSVVDWHTECTWVWQREE